MTKRGARGRLAPNRFTDNLKRKEGCRNRVTVIQERVRILPGNTDGGGQSAYYRCSYISAAYDKSSKYVPDDSTKTSYISSWYRHGHRPCCRYRVCELLLGLDESDHGGGRAVLRRSVGHDETLRAKAG